MRHHKHPTQSERNVGISVRGSLVRGNSVIYHVKKRRKEAKKGIHTNVEMRRMAFV